MSRVGLRLLCSDRKLPFADVINTKVRSLFPQYILHAMLLYRAMLFLPKPYLHYVDNEMWSLTSNVVFLSEYYANISSKIGQIIAEFGDLHIAVKASVVLNTHEIILTMAQICNSMLSS